MVEKWHDFYGVTFDFMQILENDQIYLSLTASGWNPQQPAAKGPRAAQFSFNLPI
jgi:hypothetical protein